MERRSQLSREQILRRIRGEFNDMAGMSLTLVQAARLFNLERGLCERLLDELVASGFLRRDESDSYSRVN